MLRNKSLLSKTAKTRQKSFRNKNFDRVKFVEKYADAI